MPNDKEVPKEAQGPHSEGHPNMNPEVRVPKRTTQARRLAFRRSQYSQYEDYIRQAKAAITGV